MMRLVLFDCDGTLVDSQGLIVGAMERAFEAHHLDVPSRAEIRGIIGISLVEAIDKLLKDASIDANADVIAVDYKKIFLDMRMNEQNDQQPLYEGISELISNLAEIDDILLGVATGKSRRGLDHIIAKEGWDHIFHTLQTADDAPSKPHPGMIYNALQETGADAAHTVIIGDTSYDIQMGRNAGVSTIGVNWGYHSEDMLIAAGAHGIAKTVEDLNGLLM